MCNNNGACRARDAAVMCPSFRATGDEQHLTRGRANTLRLALSGQLGPDALVGEDMRETMDLCISCKGCKRECPTGVDMARMKIEFLHHYRRGRRLSARDRLIPTCRAMRLGPRIWRRCSICAIGRRPWPGSASAGSGLSAARKLPQWSRRPYRSAASRHPNPPPLAGSAPTLTLPRWRGREGRGFTTGAT